MIAFNFKKGLFRFWILLSAIWMIVLLFIFGNELFYKLPNKAQIENANKIALDSYNCHHKNKASSRLDAIFTLFSLEISTSLKEEIENYLKREKFETPKPLEQLSDSELMSLINEMNAIQVIEKRKILKNIDCEKILQHVPTNKLKPEDLDYISQLKNRKAGSDVFFIDEDISPWRASKINGLNCSDEHYLVIHFHGNEYPFCVESKAYDEFKVYLPEIMRKRLSDLQLFLILFLVPTLALLIFGSGCFWVAKGFKKDKP